jgi:hypothetical protein
LALFALRHNLLGSLESSFDSIARDGAKDLGCYELLRFQTTKPKTAASALGDIAETIIARSVQAGFVPNVQNAGAAGTSDQAGQQRLTTPAAFGSPAFMWAFSTIRCWFRSNCSQVM